jgi:hypothetical protein
MAGRSEFERDGTHRSGELGLGQAAHKARYERRTELPSEPDPDIEAKPDKFEKGGNTPEQNGPNWWINE